MVQITSGAAFWTIAFRLITLTEHDEAIAQQLQVVGISFAGRMIQPARLCHGKGYVTLLVSEPLSTVPSGIGQLRDLVDVLPVILRLRSVLRTTIEAFRGRAGNGPRVSSVDSAKKRIPEQPSPADVYRFGGAFVLGNGCLR